MALKILYAGTPDFSVAALEALHQSKHQVIAVYTQPDRPSGRGKKLTASPVKQFAEQAGIPVFQPNSLKSDDILTEMASLKADIMVVTAYGLILPKAVLDTFRLGCINIHASLLPKWRGAAPIQRAIEAGDREAGVTIMQMDEGLDTGDMLLKAVINVSDEMNGETLHDELMALGASHIIEIMNMAEQETLSPERQNDQSSCYAHKMTKAEGYINWAESAADIDRKIRAFYPWPGSIALKQGQAIKIHSAQIDRVSQGQAGHVLKHDINGLLIACGEGAILVNQLQIPGKKRVLAKDLLNSKDWTGEVFDECSSN